MLAAKNVAHTRPSQASPERLQSIDLLRGAVMIIMALDHTRDFVHSAASQFQPEDLTQTTAAIFFTRWITHFCAPVFMFTAGIGAFLRGQRGNGQTTRAELSKFLLTRGLWLMILEVTVLRLGLLFNFKGGAVLLTILWALGLSMVVLAGLIHLPIRVLAPLSIAIIALHNLFDGVTAAQLGAFGPLSGFEWIWNILHQQGAIRAGGTIIVVAYPLIPWPAVMAAGYCLGSVFFMDPERRRRILLRLGLGLTLAFLVFKAINIYGDPIRWTQQPSPLFTILSFLRSNKYPPSLDFLLMTLGPAIAALALLDRVRVSARNPVLVFGKVPLFYFLVHIFLIHLAAILLALFTHGTAAFLFDAPPGVGTPKNLFPANYGYGLLVTYAVWLAVVTALYPLCLWFANLKQRRRDWWLGYL